MGSSHPCCYWKTVRVVLLSLYTTMTTFKWVILNKRSSGFTFGLHLSGQVPYFATQFPRGTYTYHPRLYLTNHLSCFLVFSMAGRSTLENWKKIDANLAWYHYHQHSLFLVCIPSLLAVVILVIISVFPYISSILASGDD